MSTNQFDADLAWRFLQEKQLDEVEALILGYKKELEAMAQNQEHTTGKADALSIYGYYKCVHKGERKAGLSFCQRAIDRHPDNPRHYLVLAMAWFVVGFPNKALDILERGHKVDPNYEPIISAFRDIERRRLPVLPFLSRDHRMNIWLGRIRHRFTGPKLQDDPQMDHLAP